MQQLSKKHILIAGSGPIGLYTAIILKSRYRNNIEVTVIDSHVDNYERPGIIAKQAVDIINKSFDNNKIAPIDVPDSQGIPANSVFIGDLQKSLLKHARNYKISLISDSFKQIDGQIVTTRDNQTIACDLLLDCTGEARRVASTINRDVDSNPVFNIQTIADNPIKNHFIAYVHMDKENSANCTIQDPKNKNSILWASAMHNLRTLGWQEFAEPEIVVSRWDEEEAGTRFCFYFEVPLGIARGDIEEQEAYLKTLLLLKTGESLNFIREKGKLKFVPFEVDPKIVSNPINRTSYPISIAICGDALMSPEYRFGTGVRNGILCANALVNSITVVSDEVAINEQRYSVETQGIVQEHVKEVTRSYKAKKDMLSDRDLLNAYDIYTEAYQKIKTSSEKNDEVITFEEIIPELTLIKSELLILSTKFMISAEEKFKLELAKKNKGEYFDFRKSIDLNQKALAICEKYCSDFSIVEVQRVQATAYSQLVHLYKESASEMFKVAAKSHKSDQFKSAELIYLEALDIIENQCPDAQFNQNLQIERSKIYSNLALISTKIGNEYKTQHLAEKALELAIQYGVSDIVNKASQRLEPIYIKSLSQENNLVEKIALNEKLIQIAINLKKDPSSYEKAISELKEKIVEEQRILKNKMAEIKPSNIADDDDSQHEFT